MSKRRGSEIPIWSNVLPDNLRSCAKPVLRNARVAACSVFSLVLASCAPPHPTEATFVVWAWERPEDLSFLPADADVAVQSGFVELAGSELIARGRRFALQVRRPPGTVMVHVQIDERQPVRWSTTLRRRVAAAVLHYATVDPAPRVQIDFEVRASERTILLDVLRDVRAGLPPRIKLSMTALASWCGDERWLDSAPVDEIVPMLFRMGASGDAIRRRLGGGADFRNPRCRSALAISTDEPILRAPPGRRVYLFDPHSWTRSRFADVQREVERW